MTSHLLPIMPSRHTLQQRVRMDLESASRRTGYNVSLTSHAPTSTNSRIARPLTDVPASCSVEYSDLWVCLASFVESRSLSDVATTLNYDCGGKRPSRPSGNCTTNWTFYTCCISSAVAVSAPVVHSASFSWKRLVLGTRLSERALFRRSLTKCIAPSGRLTLWVGTVRIPSWRSCFLTLPPPMPLW